MSPSPKDKEMKEEKQKWLVLDGDDGWKIIIPDSDSKPHGTKFINPNKAELAGIDCPCKPKINWIDKQIVHNSFIDEDRIQESINKLKI